MSNLNLSNDDQTSGTGQDARTLSAHEAAEFLKIHRITLLRRARIGEIPGAKIGRAWVFLKVDLMAYLRSKYLPRALQGD